MIVPPSDAANSSASADLPLAVGPATMMTGGSAVSVTPYALSEVGRSRQCPAALARRSELTKPESGGATAGLNDIQEGAAMGMLDGRVAICTGSGRGVGGEVAKLMAAHGAKVVVNDP